MDKPSPPARPSQQPAQDSHKSNSVKQHHSTCTRDLITSSTTLGVHSDSILERYWNYVTPKLTYIYAKMGGDTSSRTQPHEWNSIYTATAAFCRETGETHKLQMYKLFRAHVQEITTSQLPHLRNLSGPALLHEYIRRWNFNLAYGAFLRRIFRHLHDFWIFDNANNLRQDPIRPLDHLIVFYWRENVLTHFHSLIDTAIDIVNDARRATVVDLSIVRSLVDHLIMLGLTDCDVDGEELKSKDWLRKSSRSEEFDPRKQAVMHLYQQLFEEPFVAATAAFYRAQGARNGHPNDVATLLNEIMSLLRNEASIVCKFLRPESLSRVQRATEEELIGNHVDYLQQESMKMLRQGDYENLGVAYCLLKRVEKACYNVRTLFVRLVRDKGNSLMVNHASSARNKDDMLHHMALVEKLMTLHFDHSQIVTLCFEKSSSFYLAIDDAFRGFINRSMGAISLPVILAHYLNHLLTAKQSPVMIFKPGADFRDPNGSKNPNSGNDFLKSQLNKCVQPFEVKFSLTADSDEDANESSPEDDSEIELDLIDELVRFFLYLDDKETFCDANRRLFARRLLTEYDEDLEAQFITRLDATIGGTYTQRFRGMLQDMGMSADLNKGFTNFVQEKKAQCILSNCKAVIDAAEKGARKSQCIQDAATKDAWTYQKLPAGSTELSPSCEAVSNERPVVEQKPLSPDEEDPPKTMEAPLIEIKNDDLTVAALDLKTSVLVLNQLHWPPSTGMGLRVPDLLKRSQELFHEYYMQDKESRKLTWAYGMSTVEMDAHFEGGDYTMVTSTCQGCILLLFNKRDELTIEEIADLVNINRDEVWEQIRPFLCEKKCRLLRVAQGDAIKTGRGQKRSRNKMENDNDEHTDDSEGTEIDAINKRGLSHFAGRRLQVNERFHSVQTRIDVPSTVEVANAEIAVSAKEVAADRNTQIDCAIVRVMKSEKKMTHVELSGQVIKLLSPYFQPDAHLLKSRIERLIDLDYIRRDEEDSRVYHYCA